MKKQLKTQQVFLSKELMPYVEKIHLSGDGTISKQDVDKIKKYYGLAVPAILGEGFATLRNKPLNESERRSATYLGATTGLFDDFFEKTTLTDDYIKTLYPYPASVAGLNDNERLFNKCWNEALKECPSPELLKYYAGLVHEAQISSRLQKGQPDQQQIDAITRDKGGYSVIFYMSLFYKTLPQPDKELFYNAGALLQLENDIFDVYKDSREGISTLVTQCESIAGLRALYTKLWQQIKKDLKKTSFPQQGKNEFLKIMGGLVSRGFVCLDMLAKREKQNNGCFQPEAFNRKELICDMEKPGNILKSMHYYAQLI